MKNLETADSRKQRDTALEQSLKSLKIFWIHDESFEDSDEIHRLLESTEFDDRTLLGRVVETSFDLQMRDVPLLSANEEQHLFRRMNCLRYMAARRRSQAMEDGTRAIDLRTVKNLMEQADRVRSQIADANQRLVLKLASSFKCRETDTQDFVGEAAMVLVRAIDKFDVSRGFRFSTYATHAIQRHLFRVQQRGNRIPKYDSDLNTLEANEEDRWADSEVMALVPDLLGGLDDGSRKLIELRFGLRNGGRMMPYRELATEYGRSPERIRQRVLKVCAALREQYAESVGLDS